MKEKRKKKLAVPHVYILLLAIMLVCAVLTYLGSSDIGNVSFRCSAFQPCLKISDKDIPIHSRAFAEIMRTEKAHEAIAVGAGVLANTVAKIFSDEKRILELKS